MAAVVIPSEELRIPEHLRSRLGGPTLRVVSDPVAHTAQRRPSTRRRLLAEVWAMRLALGAVALLIGLVLVQFVGLAASSQAPPTPAPSLSAPVVAGSTGAAPAVHVVRPGDTLWSIATSVAPGRDPRPVVDELARRAGGGALQPGQRIPLEGLSG
jgi:hypothetical protein